MQTPLDLSVVVPAYRCSESLEALHHRLSAVLESLGARHEIIFVDDHSPDRDWELIVELAGRDPHVRGVRLDRNYGQAAAIAAGVTRAQGEWISVMDCDLQDSPELIARLWNKREGAEVVVFRLGERAHRRWRILASRAYFAMLRLISGNPHSGRSRNFCLAHRRLIHRYLGHPGMGGLYVTVLTSMTTEIVVAGVHDKQPRRFGSSAYTGRKLIRSALHCLSAYPRRALSIVLLPGMVIFLAIGVFSASRSWPAASIAGAVASAIFAGIAVMIVLVYRRRIHHPFGVEQDTGSAAGERR